MDRIVGDETKLITVDDFIKSAATTIPGFTDQDELFSLFSLISELSELGGDIIEIGSWCGRSSVVMGLAAKLTGAHLHCVDLFPSLLDWKRGEDGNWMIDSQFRAYHIEHPIYNDTFQKKFRPVYDESADLLEIFKGFIKLYNVEDVISIHKGNIETFSKFVKQDFQVKLAFIDGDHDYTSVCKDITQVSEWLVPSGMLCVDDVGGVFTAVTKAVDDTICQDKFKNPVKLTRKLFAVTKVGQNE